MWEYGCTPKGFKLAKPAQAPPILIIANYFLFNNTRIIFFYKKWINRTKMKKKGRMRYNRKELLWEYK